MYDMYHKIFFRLIKFYHSSFTLSLNEYVFVLISASMCKYICVFENTYMRVHVHVCERVCVSAQNIYVAGPQNYFFTRHERSQVAKFIGYLNIYIWYILGFSMWIDTPFWSFILSNCTTNSHQCWLWRGHYLVYTVFHLTKNVPNEVLRGSIQKC